MPGRFDNHLKTAFAARLVVFEFLVNFFKNSKSLFMFSSPGSARHVIISLNHYTVPVRRVADVGDF